MLPLRVMIYGRIKAMKGMFKGSQKLMQLRLRKKGDTFAEKW